DCSQAQKADGEACTLGCVTAAVCNAGVCEGTEPVVCDEPSQCLEAATCVPAFNQCVFPTKLDGLECDDGSLCTQGDQCIHGECLAGVDTTCPTNETCESVSICEPSTGECSEVLPLEDETSCDDSDPCTDVDTCIGGECISQVVKDCDDGNPCTTDSCGPTGCMYVGGTVEECVLWEVNTTGFISGPPGVHGPNLYVAAAKLAAINSDSGELLWESEEVVDCTSPSPSVSPDGSSLYIGDVDKEGKARLAHVNANTGQLEWGYSVGVGDNCAPGPQDPCRIPSVPTRTDTAIYIATRGSGVYAVSHAGKSVWHLGDADEINRSSVVASQSGNLYIGLYGGQSKGVMSMNGDGTVRWKAPTETGVVETPVVAADKIYVTAGSSVYAFADAGETANQLWTVDLGATVATTQPILDGKGSLIVASKDTLWALKTEECDNTVANCVLWTVQSPQGKISRGLSLIDDGLVSFGTQAGLQFVNTVDGTWAWGVNLPTLQVSSPAILSTGRLVVGAKDGFVRAISYKPGVSPGQSLWPVLNRDQKRNAIAF
ncbi:MAG TPA: hypothetical protein EYN06_06320, partial [Myxococcales bacterium]|nr:hypothetical protein [Myxococcales bacterium]